MQLAIKYLMAFVGIACILAAIWQWNVSSRETRTKPNTEDGHIIWALPGQIRKLGPKITYLTPRSIVEFETNVTYPTEIYEGNAFQVVLESRVSSIKKNGETPVTQDIKIEKTLKKAFHTFELELPGLDALPKGPNKFGVDDKVRWQVAPPRDPGIYRGYIRPRGGTAEILGGEYDVHWSTPGDFELKILVKRSLKYLEKFESLIFGFLGSVLSFPAILTLYRSLWSKKSKE